ncbi:hypothetical protein GCM10028791_14210 [Echinicola sediminis]
MGNFFSASYPSKVLGLALVALFTVLAACKEVDPEDPICYDMKTAWAKGGRYNLEGERVNYVEIPAYDENAEVGKEIMWVYLRLENSGEFIGAAKVRELLISEVPDGASPGQFVRLQVRIDVPDWEFTPDIANIKVGGYNEVPTEKISPELLNTHKGTATQPTGEEWVYYEVVLPRFSYYSIVVEARKQVVCVD